MLTSLLRPRRHRRRVDRSPFTSPFTASPEVARREHHDRGRPVHTSEEESDGDVDYEDEEQTYEDHGEDEDDEPLLPIFSAAQLDAIPIYATTHSIRDLIVQKCETTLSWDQLRAPQVSAFLVKPLQQQIRKNHFNKATLTALIANCLQFKKEAELNPGNAGVSGTRALLAELVAMRLLKEYSTRELIDSLSYDFDPLQGMEESQEGKGRHVQRPKSARISAVEIAIRATAKNFLAHPLVTQQLEAIWAGSIVFHSAADSLHRRPTTPGQTIYNKQRGYGAIQEEPSRLARARENSRKQAEQSAQTDDEYVRRSVTLYDPRDASLFKLSRLRVPRYRQLFSMLSFVVMLGLYLAVLIDRSLHITTLEIIFWVYSTGYMLDEIVGFSEQGFGLYILSVWNAFDLGILICLMIYYALRIYGVLAPLHDQRRIAGAAYDILASTAVLLFPRAFSVLDNYKYFSQLLIAFRLMAQDMAAILILVVISCSGFFVAFTLAFTDQATSGSDMAYALFQIVMGFSPAAWSYWQVSNPLGRMLMGFFLVVCHFLIVTILITVLTNSFMAVVRNAEQEHAFLMAVNTLSSVKSDALFSYVAPTNILSWAISPLRYIMPFRRFVKLNRTVIKITHFPILFSIFLYERMILSRIAYEPTDLVRRNHSASARPLAFGGPTSALQRRSHRLREASVVSFRKDQTLDEVFRHPFKGQSVRTTARNMEPGRTQSVNVVDTWMQNVGEEGGASPPLEQPQSVLDRLENRRPNFRRAMTSDRIRPGHRDYSTATRSILSDPEERTRIMSRRPKRIEEETDADPDMSLESIAQGTDAEDGDDELMTHDEADAVTVDKSSQTPDAISPGMTEENRHPVAALGDFFATPTASRQDTGAIGNSKLDRVAATQDQAARKRRHDRTVSTTTILFQPQTSRNSSSSSVAQPPVRSAKPMTSNSGTRTPVEPRSGPTPFIGRARPIGPPRVPQAAVSSRGLAGFTFAHAPPARRPHREPSMNTLALDLASDFGENRFGPALVDVGGISGMPASFSEQMLREREMARRSREEERRRNDAEEQGVVQRMVLNRMSTLEEGFREVISAVRDLREREIRSGPSSVGGGVKSAGSSGIDTRIGPATATGPVAMPKTPGQKSKDKPSMPKSPKKIKRPTPLRDDTTLAVQTGPRTSILGPSALPPETPQPPPTNSDPPSLQPHQATAPTTAGPTTPLPAPSHPGTDPTAVAVATATPQTSSTTVVPARTPRPHASPRPRPLSTATSSSSPNSVKSIVETLEQKGRLSRVVATQQDRRGGGGGGSSSRASSSGGLGEGISRPAVEVGGDGDGGGCGGDGGEEAPDGGAGLRKVGRFEMDPLDGSRRRREVVEAGGVPSGPGPGPGKRESVIYIGDAGVGQGGGSAGAGAGGGG